MLDNICIIVTAILGAYFYFECKKQIKLRIKDENEKHIEIMNALKTAAKWKDKYLKELNKNKQ